MSLYLTGKVTFSSPDATVMNESFLRFPLTRVSFSSTDAVTLSSGNSCLAVSSESSVRSTL